MTASNRPQHRTLGRRIGKVVGRTIDVTTGSLGRIIGAGLPPVKKIRPGAAPGIEHRDLERMAREAPAPAPGEPARPAVAISCIDYSLDQVLTRTIDDLDQFIADRRPEWSAVRWINVDGLTDMKVIHAFATKYNLHPLAIEDVLHLPQRPKVDAFTADNAAQARLFIIARMLMVRDNHLHREQISIFLGHKTVITFQETPGDVWDPIRQRIGRTGSRLRQNDASFLAYALVDAIVDHCFPILEHYGDQIDELEEQVLAAPTRDTIHHIHELRRDLLVLRRDVWPMREMVHTLGREPHECMSENTRTYLRDVYDHCVQIIDIIETYREVAQGVTETYMTAMSNRMNEVIKVLTVITVIFGPLTFLVGVYGMNFEWMPEMFWEGAYPWSYPLGFWGLCVSITGGMLLWFRHRGWL